MASQFISLHVSWIATKLYYCGKSWHYIFYFLTCQTDCIEIILLRVVMALHFISLQVRWIATKLYYHE
jgi:hypothetical protein